MKRWPAVVLLAASPAFAAGAAGPVAKAGDAGRGEALFQAHCHACHSVDPAETGLPGPNLFKVVGRKAAAMPGFDYSPALRAAARRGLVWKADRLARLIADPGAFLPGTEMTFPGLDRPDEGADIVAFLRRAASRWP